jgi:nitroimidazol reductase NimA-like FMN-containing flavoprotein (pyridoxamine 5'-phosphate oxidase superfamily)
MDTTASRPHPVVLAEYDCWGLLVDEDIARIAWASPDGVAIVPVNYLVADGALWFRTQPYTALARQCAGGRVAAEVDHVDRQTASAWSVVVIGTAEPVLGAGIPPRVVDLDIWPPGPRNLFIRVVPIEVTGRRIWGRR